ncbi:hypothetical protein V6V47_01020 [Micromonospora sp. CPCC 205539]|uniref:hypothetical protein n=1 Tax=Micromonospora sp. CPCC 205539 TaxID=3122408 RepID=UPI002FF273EE
MTTWRRLEPRTRDAELSSIAARVADPLWLLARQWQSGELTGSDTGSPTLVRLTAEHCTLTRWATGTQAPAGDGTELPAGQPIESQVDAVPVPPGLGDRARAGQHFLRLLGTTLAGRYTAALRDHYALPALDDAAEGSSDEAGRRWSRLLVGRALDGAALRAAIGSAQTPSAPPGPSYDTGDEKAVRDAAGRYARWWDARFPATGGAWTAGRLAAPFRLAAATSTGPTTLVAPEHRGGPIDWHSFDGAGATSMAAGDKPSTAVTTTALPSRISFPGMPRPRWWEFEDSAVDLGRIDAAPDDLGRLLLAEFALVYGNDFFAVPMSMAAGSFCRVVTIEVDTCFDETVTVPSAVSFDGPATGRDAWRMFHSDGAPGLVLAPSTVDTTDGAPREDVLLARDEMANLAWAVELRVTGPNGAAVDRREVESARQARAGIEPTVENTLHYRLSTTVPESWLPLLPAAGGVLALPSDAAPAGQLLGGQQGFELDAVELPRVGRRMTLVPRRARAVDGTVRVWSGWHVGPGRGESSSGLRHDELTHERLGAAPEPA